MQSNSLIVFLFALASHCTLAFADTSGPLGIDHRLNLDTSGVWSDSNLKTVEYGSALLVIAGAAYEGTSSRLGKTLWKSFDAMLMGDLMAAGAKAVFRRQRPIDGNDPNAFFQSGSDTSFPSGEMTHISAIVTPFILEYQKDTPGVWLLALLPTYVAAAKLNTQAHWQTDILAGAALGAGAGYLAFNRDASWSASVLPGRFSVGFKKTF